MDHDIQIETPRLWLRSWRDADVELYDRACNTPAVMRWLGEVDTRQELESAVEFFIEAEAEEGLTYWVVERRADGAFLGTCGLIRIPDDEGAASGKLEIGWRLREDAWRCGYGFEAATAVLDYAFGRKAVEIVFARTSNENVASRSLMRKIGLRHIKAFDYIPEGDDDVLLTYVLRRADWQNSRHAAVDLASDARSLRAIPK